MFVQSGGVARIATLQMLVDPEADFEAGVPRQALMTLSQYCGDSPSLEFSAAVRCVIGARCALIRGLHSWRSACGLATFRSRTHRTFFPQGRVAQASGNARTSASDGELPAGCR